MSRMQMVNFCSYGKESGYNNQFYNRGKALAEICLKPTPARTTPVHRALRAVRA